MPIVAWYVVSKESYINRVINDVLPTVDDHASVGVLLFLGHRETWYHTALFTKKDKSVIISPVSLRTLDAVGVELELELKLRT